MVIKYNTQILENCGAWQYEVDNTNETEDPLLGNLGASTEDTAVEEVDIIESALRESSLCLNDLDPASDTLEATSRN